MTARNEWAILDGVKTLTIQLPDPVFQWLDTAARQRRQTPEQAAAEALSAAARAKEPSLADLVADLKGIGQGKYTDLSTNKKHMDDFGR